jgi:hypothetical protein
VVDRGTTAAATTSAGVRHPMVSRSRATDGRSASKCQRKISPSSIVRVAHRDGSRHNLASVL